MINDKKVLLRKKLDIQHAKNILKCIDGIDVLDIFEIEQNLKLSEITKQYFDMWHNYKITPKSKLPFKSSLVELSEWVIATADIEENKEYFTLLGGTSIQVWAKIRIKNLNKAIESMLKNKSYDLFLVDAISYKVYDIGCDSSDEYNYLMYLEEI